MENKVILQCERCGKSFSYEKGGVGRMPKFCSEECRNEHRVRSGKEKQSICKVCGRAFTYQVKTRGRAPGFCSEECRKRYFLDLHNGYIRKRYHEDEEFRNRRKAQNARYARDRRTIEKEKTTSELINQLTEISDPGQVRSLLERHFKLKSGSHSLSGSISGGSEYGE